MLPRAYPVAHLPKVTDTAYTACDYIETYTGRPFKILTPDPAMVTIIDIAHALSNQARYGGHTNIFYPTAQHCCLLANYAQNVLKASALDCLQILMHDAAEAYLVDLQRPIKQYLPDFRGLEYDIQMVVRSWLGMESIPFPPWQDEIDSRIIHDERAQLMYPSGNDWEHAGKPLGIRIKPWTSAWAEQQFLMLYAAYSYAVYDKQHQYLRDDWRFFPSLQSAVASSDDPVIEDVIEVDLRGGVGRVKLRSPDGMLERDRNAAPSPAPAWKWVHGRFNLYIG